MGTPIRLVDETGIERFRGTQSPGGGSSPPFVVAPVKVVSAFAAEQPISPPSGPATLDGYAVQNGDRVLLAGSGNDPYTDASFGVWIVDTAGLWTRPTDFADGSTIPAGTLISVDAERGSFLYGSIWTVEGDTVVGSTGDIIAILTGESIISTNPVPGDYPQVFLSTGQVRTQGDTSFSTPGKLGFYGTAPIDQPTGVAVSAAAIHAALVSLGLITA